MTPGHRAGRRASPITARAAAALLAAALPAAVGGACASHPLLPEGADRGETARELLQQGRWEDASAVAAPLEKDAAAPMADRAEGAWLAGEADLARGEHLKAYRHYLFVLENAPWSEHSDAIEDRLFEIGEAFFHDARYGGWFGNRSRGVEVLETYQAYFRRTDRADDALRLIGDWFFDEGEWEESAFTYERLLEDYPESEWVERAIRRAGESRRHLNRGPEYDRDELLRAKSHLEGLLARFPRGVEAEQAAAELREVRERLARCELVVADFYRGRGIEAGERVRLANAWLLYGDTEAGALAQQRLLALGVDLQALRGDPSLSSVDSLKPGAKPWQEER